MQSNAEKTSKVDKLAIAVKSADTLLDYLWKAIQTEDDNLQQRLLDAIPSLQKDWEEKRNDVEGILKHYGS